VCRSRRKNYSPDTCSRRSKMNSSYCHHFFGWEHTKCVLCWSLSDSAERAYCFLQIWGAGKGHGRGRSKVKNGEGGTYTHWIMKRWRLSFAVLLTSKDIQCIPLQRRRLEWWDRLVADITTAAINCFMTQNIFQSPSLSSLHKFTMYWRRRGMDKHISIIMPTTIISKHISRTAIPAVIIVGSFQCARHNALKLWESGNTTGWAKKRGHRLMTIILPVLNRFKIFFTKIPW